MATNPLVELEKLGQSVWYDQMERSLITKGTLSRLIEDDHLRGLTSNPTIFEKAIGGSRDYDDLLESLARQNKSTDEIYSALIADDLGQAADLFLPVYERTKGEDGYVSLEVNPTLAQDTAGTLTEAKRYFEMLGRRNVMIKIPATPEGIPAIEEAIAAGINVNITLIFSREVYGKVIEAYIKGLERRAAKNLPIGDIASVASFFVSRIDTKADKQIEEKLKKTTDAAQKAELESLSGKIAIANAKMAYKLFREVFTSERFEKLRAKGARVQRPLWASTGTKNPKYRDVLYIEELIGPDTVNTIPPATYDAFKDHGRAIATLEAGTEDAERVLARFEALGMSLETITNELTTEGVKSFSDSFVSLLGTIESRRDVTMRQQRGRETAALGEFRERVDQALFRIQSEKTIARLWKKDPALWKNDEAHQKIIANSLGWLSVVDLMLSKAAELRDFAEETKKDFTHAVVLGMGGSSLFPEVLSRVFGRQSGYPQLHVLDSTVPGAIRLLESKIDPSRTLFIVASKSGSTTEPHMFYRYFFEQLKKKKGERAGENFIAVTDPGTQLDREATADRFRRIFRNPADIGGRYSALSYFGMVPAAVMGLDIAKLLERASHAVHACSPGPAAEDNPGAYLGAVLAVLAQSGRDKLTLVTPHQLESLGLWIEQLIAESTGKEGKGIVPIAGEPLLAPQFYGKDRLFVVIRLAGTDDEPTRTRLSELRSAGHPIVEHDLSDVYDLGDEFFIWEFATAVAGHLLGINPFDQPNVQESKDNTKRLLDEFHSSGKLADQFMIAEEGALRMFAGEDARKKTSGGSFEHVLSDFIGQVREGDYVALTEYLPETSHTDASLKQIREELMKALRVATTTGYGPRFLHSTGQLHKGGAGNGVFIQLTADDSEEIPIEGENVTFSTLKKAQSLGDFQSLESRQRRAIRIDLGKDIDSGLKRLSELVQKSVAARK